MKTMLIIMILGLCVIAGPGCQIGVNGYLLPLQPMWGYTNNSWSYYNGWNGWNNNYYGSSQYGNGTIYWSEYTNNNQTYYGGVFLPAGCNSTCGLRYQGDYYYSSGGYRYPVRYFGY